MHAVNGLGCCVVVVVVWVRLHQVSLVQFEVMDPLFALPLV